MQQKTFISKKFSIEKSIKNSFKYLFMLYHEAKIHTGIKKVLKSKKNKEIPSTPKFKFILEYVNKNNLFTNWNFAVDLSNKIQIIIKPRKEKMLKLKAIILIKRFSFTGKTKIKNIPKIGKLKFSKSISENENITFYRI